MLGVPAIVAGLGAGLDRSTFSNFAEAREAAYEQTIIPTQKTLGEDIWFQLLPDFESASDIWLWRIGFDLSKVRVLQPDMDKLAARLDVGIRGSWLMRSDGRRAMGYPVAKDGSDDVYLVPLNTALVPADGGPHRTFVPSRDARAGEGDRRGAVAATNGTVSGEDLALLAIGESPNGSEGAE